MRRLMLSVDIEKYSLDADEFLQRMALSDPIWKNHCLENEDSISDSKFISKFLTSPAHQESVFLNSQLKINIIRTIFVDNVQQICTSIF